VAVIAIPIASGLMNWPEYMAASEVVKDSDTYVDSNGHTQTWSPRTLIRKHVERRCCYEVINMELQTCSMHAALFLERAGYRTAYMPTTYGQTLSWPGNYIWDFPKPPQGFAPFSHRHAAVAAGLGRFGLNNLLLTPEYGPRQRLVSLITEAPLNADPMLSNPVCLGDKCGTCLRKCPAKAFGKTREVNLGCLQEQMAEFDPERCRGYYKDAAKGSQCSRECMVSCPLAQAPVNDA
jgi:ferredoxin